MDSPACVPGGTLPAEGPSPRRGRTHPHHFLPTSILHISSILHMYILHISIQYTKTLCILHMYIQYTSHINSVNST